MSAQENQLRQFGKFRLDVEKKVLWHESKPVNLPLKEVELLCALTENVGQVVTKDELLTKVWADSFVEESNLSRHIYLLRKTFKDLGEEEEIIQTVPRRGYRFAGDISLVSSEAVLFEKHSLTRTTIENVEGDRTSRSTGFLSSARTKLLLVGCAVLVAGVAGLLLFRSRADKPQSPNPNVAVNSIRSIAVLPLRNISLNRDDDYLGVGIAEVLTTRLNGLNRLNVRPYKSTQTYNESQLDGFAIGRELHVDAVLEGSAQRHNDRLRVTLRLLNVSNQSTIWAGQFDEKLSDVLQMQDSVAQQVVSALSIRLSEDENQRLTHRYTTDADAHHLYLRGLYYWNTRREYEKAATYFNLAIEKDPKFALAHSGLGQVLATGTETLKAEFSIRRSLELDPNLAEAHAALGFYLMFVQWRWTEAEAELVRAISLKPGYAPAHQWHALLFAIKGRYADAESAMKRGLEIDPTSPNLNADMGQVLYLARDYDRAIEFCNKARTVDPDSRFAYQHLTGIYFKKGLQAETIAALEKFHILGTRMAAGETNPEFAEQTSRAAQQGLQTLVNLRIKDLKLGDAKARSPFWLAHAYAFLDDRQQTLHWLEQAVEQPSHSLTIAFTGVDPLFDSIKDEPRFHRILERMNLR